MTENKIVEIINRMLLSRNSLYFPLDDCKECRLRNKMAHDKLYFMDYINKLTND